MEHSFDIEVAKEYGVLEAVIIKNFQYWILKNIANRKNFMDGRYWTYNSLSALCELFPYVSSRQIRYAIDNLIEKGVFIKGCFNEDKRDRTIWFSFADFGKWICQNCQMTSAKIGNCICQNCQMLNIDNNINTDSKHTDNKQSNSKPIESGAKETHISDDIQDEEKEKGCAEKEKEWDEVLKPWLEYKKERKQTYKSQRALKALKTKLINLSGGDLETARLIIEQSMANNYAGLFELKGGSGAAPAPRKKNANDDAFDEFYRQKFGTGFVWQRDTSDEIQKLSDALKAKADEAGYTIASGEMPEIIKQFLHKAWSIEDQWLRDHFTPKNINNQFNTIYAYIKSGRKSPTAAKNPYGVSEDFLRETLQMLGGVQP